jgi:type I restriction enzyme S subunit
VTANETSGQDIALGACGAVVLDADDHQRFSLRPGDIVLARAIGSESHLGKTSIVEEMPEGGLVFDSHLMRVRTDLVRLLPEFLMTWLKSPGGRARFLAKSARTAVQFNINALQFNDIDVPLPPLASQRVFVGRLKDIRSTTQRGDVALAQTDALFASLQPRAFRGEL